ncbi:unnamed protein product [Nesidiocoris tenuis]|uniref:Uncharacterized protein n=1 Tax=Nesidiocoris tenuis TaxID=355587 RepID=A0A6H5HKD6_9HEMI|nr:unnamed protein product [Nesidiocoris tenuis]
MPEKYQDSSRIQGVSRISKSSTFLGEKRPRRHQDDQSTRASGPRRLKNQGSLNFTRPSNLFGRGARPLFKHSESNALAIGVIWPLISAGTDRNRQSPEPTPRGDARDSRGVLGKIEFFSLSSLNTQHGKDGEKRKVPHYFISYRCNDLVNCEKVSTTLITFQVLAENRQLLTTVICKSIFPYNNSNKEPCAHALQNGAPRSPTGDS